MNFLEKDLEEVIFKTHKSILTNRGLPMYGKVFRQLKLGKYGIADLVSVQRHYEPHSSHYKITIYELKKDKIGISALLQAIGYAKAVQHYMFDIKETYDFIINIVLIGKEIDVTGSFCFIPDLFRQEDFLSANGQICLIQNFTYHFDINGFIFKEHCEYQISNAFTK